MFIVYVYVSKLISSNTHSLLSIRPLDPVHVSSDSLGVRPLTYARFTASLCVRVCVFRRFLEATHLSLLGTPTYLYYPCEDLPKLYNPLSPPSNIKQADWS